MTINFINKIIFQAICILPKALIKPIAFNYVAGEDIEKALNVSKQLNEAGFSVTIDILGEHTSSKNEADMITQKYLLILKHISQNELDCNISVKPTHIGLDLGEDVFMNNYTKLINNTYDNFIRIDMENSKVTDLTIDGWINQFKSYKNTGIVIQSYLKRSLDDVKMIHQKFKNFNLRLCKGIYKESSSIAFNNRKQINEN